MHAKVPPLQFALHFSDYIGHFNAIDKRGSVNRLQFIVIQALNVIIQRFLRSFDEVVFYCSFHGMNFYAVK